MNDLLTEFFPNIVDVNFTATMEGNLDKVASGQSPWIEVIRSFYEPFSHQLAHAQEEMPEVKAEPEKLGRACPVCGHELVIRWGRFGKFISCSDFPNCRHTEPWLEKIGILCPEDGEKLWNGGPAAGAYFTAVRIIRRVSSVRGNGRLRNRVLIAVVCWLPPISIMSSVFSVRTNIPVMRSNLFL